MTILALTINPLGILFALALIVGISYVVMRKPKSHFDARAADLAASDEVMLLNLSRQTLPFVRWIVDKTIPSADVKMDEYADEDFINQIYIGDFYIAPMVDEPQRYTSSGIKWVVGKAEWFNDPDPQMDFKDLSDGMSLRAALVRACSMFSAYDMDETWRDAFIDDLVPEEKWPSSG